MIAASLMMAMATPAYAGVPCEPRPPLCQAVKKDRSTNAEQRKAPRQETCIKRYALM